MRVLVSTASKYQATWQIAEVIAQTLHGEGLDVDVLRPEEVERVDGYDAFVLGSAVYAGHWLQAARTLVKAHAAQLAERPVWLFSSGPLGHPPKPEGDPVEVAEFRELLRIRGHEVFAGKLDKSRLSFMERAMVMALHAPEGDHRNWVEIRRFARRIGRELQRMGTDLTDHEGVGGEPTHTVVDVTDGATDAESRTDMTQGVQVAGDAVRGG